jgi:hypothetical protein
VDGREKGGSVGHARSPPPTDSTAPTPPHSSQKRKKQQQMFGSCGGVERSGRNPVGEKPAAQRTVGCDESIRWGGAGLQVLH